MRPTHTAFVRPRWIELGGLTLSLLTTMAACGSPTGPTTANYALAAESAHFKYYFGGGDRVDSAWEEQFHVWAHGAVRRHPAAEDLVLQIPEPTRHGCENGPLRHQRIRDHLAV